MGSDNPSVIVDDDDDNQTVTTMDTTTPYNDNNKKIKNGKYQNKMRGNEMSDDEENVYELVNGYDNKPSSPLSRERKLPTKQIKVTKDNDNPMSPSSLETPQPNS